MQLQGRVFVTGGAGFLARGLYRRAAREDWDVQFTCFSRDDAKHVALQRKYPGITCIRGDICGPVDYLTAAMAGHDLVIHAAAVKYVDLAEFNAADTVRVNIHGSENVITAAHAAHVGRAVAISTDKAALPVNIYGKTKAVMESLFVEAARTRPETDFVCCRYGNVIGSTGSVIPKFKEQLATTGEVLVTNPDMTRFWMSVDEAVDVILVAALHAHPGATVIPKPRAMAMVDVVHAVAGADHMRIIGLRPGEKMHELLVHLQESVRATLPGELVVGFDGLEIWPPGTISPYIAFEWSSETAERMSAAEMAKLIADAETV